MDTIYTQNLDANESAFFARELEFVKSKTYDIKYPNLKATKLIPMSMDAGAGADTITYQQLNSAGIAKIIANYADDLPRADVFGKEFTSNVRTIGMAYGYNRQEIRAAQMAGRPLRDKKATATRKANDEEVNRIGWFGDDINGLIGFLTQPNVPSAVVATGITSGNVRWIGGTPKNPAEILQDMNDAVTRIISLTLGVENPNTILLPIDQQRKIATTRLDSGTDTTIMEYFLKNNPQINVIEWVNELNDVSPAPSGGASPTDIGITYEKNIDILSFEIPMTFTQLAPQERNLEFVVNTESRNGGVIVYYPLAIDFMEGI